MTSIPENLILLAGEEDRIAALNKASVTKDDELAFSMRCIEGGMNVITHAIHLRSHSDDDDLALRLLGLRLFNGIASSLKLVLSGYYQASVLVQRDVLETTFLVDFFGFNRARVKEWRLCNEKERYQKFRPGVIRDALDKRDGFVGKKRGEAYSLMSSLGGHASNEGFAMVRQADGQHRCGPFVEQKSLSAVLVELAKHSVQAGTKLSELVEPVSQLRNADDVEVRLAFLEIAQEWSVRYLGAPSYASRIVQIREALSQMRAKGIP